MRISLLLLSFLLLAANAQANDVQLFNPDLFGQPTSVAVKLLFDKKPNEIEPYMVKTDIKCGKYYAASIFYRGKVAFGDIRASLNKLYKNHENMKLLKEPVQASWRVDDKRFSIYLTQEAEDIFKVIYIQFQSNKEMFKAMMKAEGADINAVETEFPDKCEDASKQ
jgi:hypothetical protein